jgi:hypothetical protein
MTDEDRDAFDLSADPLSADEAGGASAALDHPDPDPDPEPDVVELPPPNVRGDHRFGPLGEFWSWYRMQRRRQQKAEDGYVQWYLIDGTFPEPKFVKPKPKGGGLPELDHDGGTYVFPREAMLASEREGIWTVVHAKGEAEPINLRDPMRESIAADELDEYLSMRVTSSPPSLLDKLDLNPQTILYAGIGLIIAYAFLRQALAGGLF